MENLKHHLRKENIWNKASFLQVQPFYHGNSSVVILEGNIDQTDGMYLIFEKSISCTLVTTYFKVENSWFKISIDQGKHIVNEMDVLTHVNESNTTVWNIRHEQPKLLQEIRISFMKKVRKSEDCADVARLWKLNYQILRDVCTNAKRILFSVCVIFILMKKF